MKYGILSDIHSNLSALDAALAGLKAEGVEESLFLGDAVGYYSRPNEVLERLAGMDCWKMVLGNHDAACLNTLSLSSFSPPAAEAIRWTRPRLRPESWKFLQKLRVREEIGDLTLVHASPFQSESWHYMTGDEDLARNFRFFQGSLCFYGHVHKAMVVEQQADGGVRRLEGDAFTLDANKRYMVNAGSVGQPRDGDPRACFMTYDSSTALLRIHRAVYDHEGEARRTQEAGLPEFLAHRLLTGK